MKIIDNTLPGFFDSINALRCFLERGTGNFCFFDIETTGLSAKISSLYLIGVLWPDSENGLLHTRQWFADDYISEAELLRAFRDFLTDFDLVIHYNGTGFDVPYLEKKYASHSIPSAFEGKKQLDIFRELRGMKTLFAVPDLKLSTVEKLTGFLRRDEYSGKECISLYSQYMQKKYFRDPEKDNLMEKLLRHNEEDIRGTYLSAQLLAYKCRLSFSHAEKQSAPVLPDTNKKGPEPLNAPPCFLCLHYLASCSYPFPLTCEIPTGCPDSSQTPSILLTFQDSEATLQLPVFQMDLCYFFPNYKEYYYLPAEDRAIHKSVGFYVDKEHRQPAKASNCYMRKEGLFVPLPAGFFSGPKGAHSSKDSRSFHLFRRDYRAKQHFAALDELLPKDTQKQDLSLLEPQMNQILWGWMGQC